MISRLAFAPVFSRKRRNKCFCHHFIVRRSSYRCRRHYLNNHHYGRQSPTAVSLPDLVNKLNHLPDQNNGRQLYQYQWLRYMGRDVSARTGDRSRKRSRLNTRARQHNRNHKIDPDKGDEEDEEIEMLPPYPPGKPWRVLFFRPYGSPVDDTHTKGDGNFMSRWRIPSLQDWRRAWGLYMETWEGGLRGEVKPDSDATQQPDETKTSDETLDQTTEQTKASLEAIKDNASRNLKLVRQDAHVLLETTKDQTGIHNLEDMKALAAEMMKLATECIKEFMAGYRQGRNDEIDKMLNEYFQEGQQENEKGAKSHNEKRQHSIDIDESSPPPHGVRPKKRKQKTLRQTFR